MSQNIINVNQNQTTKILALIAPFVKTGRILPRSYAQIQQNLAEFITIERAGKLIACAGLVQYPSSQTPNIQPNHKMSEIYALAVCESAQNQGISAELLAKIIQKSRATNCTQIFAMSKYETHWFIKNHFQPATLSQLPPARQATYDPVRAAAIFIKTVN